MEEQKEQDPEKRLLNNIVTSDPIVINGKQVHFRVAPPTAIYTYARIIVWDVIKGELWRSGKVLIRGPVGTFGDALNKWRGEYSYPKPQPIRKKGENGKYQIYIEKYLQIFDIAGETKNLTAYRTQFWQEYKLKQIAAGRKTVEVSKERFSFRDALDYALEKWKEERASKGWNNEF